MQNKQSSVLNFKASLLSSVAESCFAKSSVKPKRFLDATSGGYAGPAVDDALTRNLTSSLRRFRFQLCDVNCAAIIENTSSRLAGNSNTVVPT